MVTQVTHRSSQHRLLRRAAASLIGAWMVWAAGCAAPPHPEAQRGYMTVAPGEYHVAFDAAQEVARSYGMVPALRDRRSGVLETAPAVAGSLLEPWDRATKSFEQAAASTVSYQRRRARFEFRPAGFGGGAARELAELEFDLTAPEIAAEEVELRVWVYNERAHIPGIRRSEWSRRLTTRTEVVDPETGRPLHAMWTVVSRDHALEEQLLSEVIRNLGR